MRSITNIFTIIAIIAISGILVGSIITNQNVFADKDDNEGKAEGCEKANDNSKVREKNPNCEDLPTLCELVFDQFGFLPADELLLFLDFFRPLDTTLPINLLDQSEIQISSTEFNIIDLDDDGLISFNEFRIYYFANCL
ncbi:MAG: hypothetical protein IIA81_02720 [Thaumarchaeota archaeon]|nr:hypothetical protein [Nitrososphaerota archaeon]